MNPLVQKEIRLLSPAYGLALGLAIVPVWLLPKEPNNTPAFLSVFLFWFGAVMLALSAFGREFGLRTFSLILAQPLQRNRIWGTKVGVLAGAMATVFAAWCLSCVGCVQFGMGRTIWLETISIGGTIAVVTFVGGLWTTLLLRQVAAAFWFTNLIPGAIIIAIGTFHGSAAMVFTAMGIYSILGFLLARWLFSRIQEAGWTGGVISFPSLRKEGATFRPSLRMHRPRAALFWKEFQLQQISLAGIAWLFLMHLGVVAARKFGQDSLGDTLRSGLEVFSGIWLIVPLLVGCSSVAEERKLGTIQAHLCLPISSRFQYFLKLLLVLSIGGVLSGLLLWTAEGIGSAFGGNSNLEIFKLPFQARTLGVACLIFLGLSLIGFYASTLTRNIVQALAAAVATTAGVWMCGILAAGIAFGSQAIFGLCLWRGYLVFYVAVPVLVAILIALAYRNFRLGSENQSLWRHNLLGMAGALLFIITFTAAVFNRAWELVTPLEPGHGPGRLAEPNSAKALHLQSYGGSALAALLPDGRLWVDRIAHDPGRLLLAFGPGSGFWLGGMWKSLSGNQMEPGSNWIAVAATFRETVAIRADGTLWISEKPRLANQTVITLAEEMAFSQEEAPLVRFGQETNWQNVVQCGYDSMSMVLQKRDGTLWRWRPDHPLPNNSPRLGLRSFEPSRLGAESDWARILSTIDSVYAWKKDGRAWMIHPPGRELRKEEISIEPDVVIERLSSFDNFKWISLTRCWPMNAAVRADGTLWAWTMLAPANGKNGQGTLAQPPVQIGDAADWTSVAGDYGTLAALKTDGSLWQWNFGNEHREAYELARSAPTRLGKQNDWIGVGNAMGGTVSLAADGSLWYWWDRSLAFYSENSEAQPMLAPSRRPSKIENILEAKAP